MEVLSGGTRFVFLIKGKAIKVARIRPCWVIVRAGFALYSSADRARLRREHDKSFFELAWRTLFSGLYANRAEWRFWQKTKDPRCVPVLEYWFWGLIIIQCRAKKATVNEIIASNSSALFASEKELSRPEQFGWFQGEIKIVDYAHWGEHMGHE